MGGIRPAADPNAECSVLIAAALRKSTTKLHGKGELPVLGPDYLFRQAVADWARRYSKGTQSTQ